MSPRFRPLLLATFLTAALPAPHGQAAAVEPPADAARALRSCLAAGRTSRGTPLLSLEALRLFYAERSHRPAWLAGGLAAPQADDLVAALGSADRKGLRPSGYHLAEIEDLLLRLRDVTRSPGETAGGPVDLDLLLSDAFAAAAQRATAPQPVKTNRSVPSGGNDGASPIAHQIRTHP